MPADHPFDTHFNDYDRWFDDHANIFRSELLAIRHVLPEPGDWVEVGVGSGRFAMELGIKRGVEPASGIASLASSRGIHVLKGVAEDLPLRNESMDALFYITSLCFMPDLVPVFSEAARVLRTAGCILAAFLPMDSAIGAIYDANASKDRFYSQATLHSRSEILSALAKCGFQVELAVHTLTGEPTSFDDRIETPSCGHEQGSFVVVRARKMTPV